MEGVLEKYQDLLEADQIQIGCIVHEQHSNLSQLYAPLEHIFKEGTSIDRTADLAAYLAKISKFANDNVLLKASGVNCSTGLLLMFDVYAATHKFSEYSTNITYLTPTSTLPTTQETILPLSPLEIQQELSTFFSELGLGDFKWSLISTGDLQCDAGLQQLPIPPLLLPRYIDILKRGLYALQKEYIESSMLNSRRYAEAVQVECRDSMNSVECVVADRREVAIIAEELVRNGWRTASLGSTGA